MSRSTEAALKGTVALILLLAVSWLLFFRLPPFLETEFGRWTIAVGAVLSVWVFLVLAFLRDPFHE